MLALISAGILMMKVIVVVEERARGMARLSFARWFAFSCLWLGMRPRVFAAERAAREGGGALMVRGAIRALIGAGFLVAAFGGDLIAPSVFALVGFSLVVHFGVCNLLAGAWRVAGFDTGALFVAPLFSQSLGEFWSKRWNLAFSEMTAIAVYSPMKKRTGKTIALVMSFAVSGLLHEMAISLPVVAGIGFPMLFFVLHGVLVGIERALAAKGKPIEGALGRVWTIFWLVAPMPILFHPAFLRGVVWPMVGITVP